MIAADISLVRRIEEAGFITWPAFERLRYDGWELRATRGVTRRANSVNPVTPSSLPLEDKLAFATAWFDRRSQPVVYRLTQLADAGLDEMLGDRGFRRSPPTHTLVHRRLETATPPGVVLAPSMADEWFDAFCRLVGRKSSSATELQRLLLAIPGPIAFASVTHRSRIIAVGLGVVHEDIVGIYNMNTDAGWRRRGVARQVLSALCAHGSAHGARLAFLQVNDGNHAARQLYADAGFTALYPYWYREPAG